MALFPLGSRSAPGLAKGCLSPYLRIMSTEKSSPPEKPAAGAPVAEPDVQKPGAKPAEHGGPPGPEPTRYGDWEKNGRCIDF